MGKNFYLKDNFCTPYKLAFHKLQKCIQANGGAVVSDVREADAVVVGVCAAFEADENRSSRTLKDVYDRKAKDVPVHVIGCMVRVRPDRMPSPAKLYFSWQHEELIRDLFPEATHAFRETAMPSGFRTREDYRVYNPKKCFVNVSLGCAFSCSYCPHKLGAGELESRSFSEIEQQLRELFDREVETIVLTGLDTASYGKDTGSSFPLLLEHVLSIAPKHVKIHIAQFNPEGIADPDARATMLRCCRDHRVRDLQLPVQTASPRLLGLMRRDYAPEDVADFVRRAKEKNPGLFVRTDLMAGFPSETGEEWEASVAFCRDTFDEVAVYAYEPKKGTEIMTSGCEFIAPEVIESRRQRGVQTFRDAGLLVHMGAQNMDSLLKSDLKKHKNSECL